MHRIPLRLKGFGCGYEGSAQRVQPEMNPETSQGQGGKILEHYLIFLDHLVFRVGLVPVLLLVNINDLYFLDVLKIKIIKI